MKKTDWKEKIERERREKDEFFKRHPRSPIPREERKEFVGLTYYPLDPKYRFELDLLEYEEKGSITLETTQEEKQEYRRWGEFQFEINGENYTLQAYKSNSEEERLWAPFKDETNGEETYGGGRYLDLEPEKIKRRKESGYLI